MKISKKDIVIAIAIAFFIGLIVYSKSLGRKNEIVSLQDDVYNLATSYGLNDVRVELTYNSGLKLYDVVLYCSNFDDISFKEMLEIASYDGSKGPSGREMLRIDQVISGGSEYSITTVSKTISKDHEIVYTEYDFPSSTTINKSSGSYQTVSSADSQYWFAVTAAQNLVRDNLKAPSTAKFPASSSAYTVERNGNSYKVTGYVDAQNSFGALLRKNWTASFKMGDTSGSTYSVSDYSVSIDE